MAFNRKRVAELLAEELESQDWKATALSRKAGLHEHAVYHFLNQKTNNVQKLAEIAKVLGKPLSYFLGEDTLTQENTASKFGDIPYDGQLMREAMEVIETILVSKNIPLNKDVIDNFTFTLYKHAQKEEQNGKISKEYALGIIEFAIDNHIIPHK